MRFFKHFADARTKTSMQMVIEELGVVGYAYFFIIVELCVAKWDHKEDDWENCEFRFHRRLLSNELRIKSGRLDIILKSLSECGLFTHNSVENIFIIKMPKLLKFLDKDSKFNRKRIVNASSETTLDKEEEKEEEIKGTEPEVRWHQLATIWNVNRGNLPEVRELNASRQRQAIARWKECSDSEEWSKVADYLAHSKFHKGENDRGWVANFDYFLRPKTRIEISERLTRQKPNQEGQWI